MIKVENSVEINKSVEEVFEYVVNIENLPQWAGPVLEAKQTSEGPVGVGTTQSQVAQLLGRKIESTLEVTEYELNKKYTTKSTSGPIPIEVQHNFEQIPGGTRLETIGLVDASGFFKLAEPLVARTLKRQTEGDVKTLKELMEAST